MPIVRFDSKETGGAGMQGLTFDLDTRMLEDVFRVTRSEAYGAIERKLTDNGFVHVQHGVYFLDKGLSSVEFAFLVRRIFSSFRCAPAVRDLQGFEVMGWSTMTDEIHEGHGDLVALGRPLWP